MSEVLIIGKNMTTSTGESVAVQVQPVQSAPVEKKEVYVADEAVYDEASDATTNIDAEENIEGEVLEDETDEISGENDIVIEPGFEDGAIIDPGFIDGEYIDPGFIEGGYMDPGMETGMAEVKDPLLSSWPFVIGISAGILVVSIALGALLAKLKIKKGIDLYED